MPDFYRINCWFIGMKKTKELLYTGDSVSADDTERLGIVNRVVPVDELEEDTQATVVKHSLVLPEVMRFTKKPINRTYEIMELYEALKTNIDFCNVLHTAEIPELVEFERIIEDQGLKAALKWRESRYS